MTSWVLIDESNGAKCGSGESLSPASLAHIAEACQLQLNREYAAAYGGSYQVRASKDALDIAPGECVYVFKAALPDAPGASAYHDNEGNGVPASFCAVTTCDTLLGANGVSVDASHELLEASRDEACNQFANDGKGTLHAIEVCDAVEVQGYPVTCQDGTLVQVSNFLLPAWLNPAAPPPYDYMTSAGLPGAVSPQAPLQTAPSPGGNGNYQDTMPSDASDENSTFGHVLEGLPKKVDKVMHWSSRTTRRIAATGKKV